MSYVNHRGPYVAPLGFIGNDITELLLKVALNTINQPTRQLVVET
jgi:hypothetical protein